MAKKLSIQLCDVSFRDVSSPSVFIVSFKSILRSDVGVVLQLVVSEEPQTWSHLCLLFSRRAELCFSLHYFLFFFCSVCLSSAIREHPGPCALNKTLTCTIGLPSQFRPMLPTAFWTRTWIGKWAPSASLIPWITWPDLRLETGVLPWTRTSTWRWAAKTLPPHSLWPCGLRHCPSAAPSTSPTLRRWTTRLRWCLTAARIPTCIPVMTCAWTLTCSMATWPPTLRCRARSSPGRRPTLEWSEYKEIW